MRPASRHALAPCLLLLVGAACGSPKSGLQGGGSSVTALVATDLALTAPRSGLAAGQLAGTGGDPNSEITFALEALPTAGTVTLLDPNGLFHYVTAAATADRDQFTFVAVQGTVRSKPATVTITLGDGGVHGALTYDFVPTTCNDQRGSCSLNYAGTTPRPIRQAVVRLVDAAQPDAAAGLLARTVSDANGMYLFGPTTVKSVLVDVVAAMDVPRYQVQDNTQNGGVYVMRSTAVDPTAAAAVDLHAASGGTQTGQSARVAAPFAILDVGLRAAETFLAARPELVLAPLRLNWSVNNRPQCCDAASGAITTSHWDGSNLYLLGAANIDEDEYDSHVTAHEWGHYFETTQARSDSPGGPHGPGDLLEPRIAFSEGWGNAESAMTLYPDARYTDCSGQNQGAGFFLDLDDMDAVDSAPGYFSESSVGGILYELFDPSSGSKTWDHVALGLGPIIDVMRGAHRNTPAVTSLFSFIDGLKRANPGVAGAIDTIVAHRQISTITDPYGTQETHDAGFAGSLPVFVQATIGGTVTLGFDTPTAGSGGQADPTLFNKIGSNHLVRFVGDGRPVTLTATAVAQTTLTVYSGLDAPQLGNALCTASPCVQTLADMPTTASKVYIVNVQVDDPRAERISCQLQIAH